MNCAGDFSGDGVVGTNDLLMVLEYWGEVIVWGMSGDGSVGIANLVLVLSKWGNICG